MRLEIDTTVSAPPSPAEGIQSGSVDSAEAKSALNQGIKAAQAGNRAQARSSLLRATELDRRNENAWLWLASISEYPEELLGFLNQVLEINPANERANEWKIATHALLSKTFVQRGIDACHEQQKEFAAECFQTALEYDDRNAVAWMWMASLSDSNTVKVALLEKALAIEPENKSASSALDAARESILKERLTQAKSAAVAGNLSDSIGILDSLLEVYPDSIEAWMMKSHLSEGFDEKIRCFECILAIDPENIAAKASRDSLLSIFGTAEAAQAESSKDADVEEDKPAAYAVESHKDADVEDHKPAAYAVESHKDADVEVDRSEAYAVESTAGTSPAPDLEVPAGFSNGIDHTYETATEYNPEKEYEDEKPEIVAEPFASFAKETSYPVEAAPVASEELSLELDWTKSHVEPIEDEVFIGDAFYGDPYGETVAFEYDSPSDSAQPEIHPQAAENIEWSDVTSEPAIAMPVESLDPVEAPGAVGFETFVETARVQNEDEPASAPAGFETYAETAHVQHDYEPASAPAGLETFGETAQVQTEDEPASAPADLETFVEAAPLQTEHEPASAPAVYETFGDTPEVLLTVRAESVECPYCHSSNDPQVISCQSCMAVLTLSDLELILGNQNPDKPTVRRAVEEMERERSRREFGSDELVILGLGHLNLRNLQSGYSCLQTASRLSPNNVVLGGQVNSLLIRLEEIRKQEEAQLKMPKGKSILVVDDSPTVRKLIASKLEKCGHEVVLATDGVEAMERLEHFVPDLILLDITMPRMDGYQVCKQIRSNSATKDVTVVMISGKDGFFDKVRGRMAGTTGYITKPFGPETLMKAVEMYLSGEAPELDEA